MTIVIARAANPVDARRLQEVLTGRLPQWFGQAESNRHYAEQAAIFDAWVARADGEECGLLLLKRHSAVAAEIYWMGVDPKCHRQGVGRALITEVVSALRAEGVKFLFVSTLHASVDYAPYALTRRFYESLGFELALSSGHGLPKADDNPLTIYLKVLRD